MEGIGWIDIIELFAVGLFVLANGFFVAAEFSLVSVRRTRIAELVARGEKDALAVQKAIEKPDQVIAATQLGITLASLALGWIGEPALAKFIYPLVSLFPVKFQAEVSHTISAVIAFMLITFLHVVAGELAPKSIALQNPERTSLLVAGPTLLTEKIFKPAIWLLNGAGNALLRIMKIRPASGHELVHSVEELKMLVTASAESGVVEVEEREMLHAVFDFGALIVRQVMIPRTEITAVEADMSMQAIISLVSQSTYTKFPVFDDSLDQILGIVHVKDLLNAMQSSECNECIARDFVREALYVPETISVSALLREFRDAHQHIAIVMDEFGGTAGLVTLEDLLEEIVGEVSDPFDNFNPGFQPQSDGSILIDGLTLINVVNAELDLHLHDPNYDTIAGFVLGKLGRVSRLHDMIEDNGVRIRVEEMDGLRIAAVSVTKFNNSTKPLPPVEKSQEPSSPLP